MMQLRTLGRLELVSGEPAALHVLAAQPKPLALLAYLALATPRGQHSRDSLLALFWPELGDDEARRALRQALHRIRYHVGDALLKSEREGQIGIADDGAWCDAIAFEQSLDAGRDADALALYHGAFLDAVFVSDASAEFEQWADLTRARLRDRAAKAAAKLAEVAKLTGDHAGAVRWSAQACQLAPEDESKLRAHMAALAASGDRAGALRAYKGFAELMEREYDAEPAKETAELAESVRAGPVAAEVERVAAPADVDGSKAAYAPPLPDSDVPPAVASPGARWSRRRRWIAAAVTATAPVLLVAFAVLHHSLPTSGVDRILVADFHNHTRDSLLAGAITEAMRA
ncbi:MAG: BTAD domain-containing putative transcriptional regulator, partial [Gemmatimonadota bacterium]